MNYVAAAFQWLWAPMVAAGVSFIYYQNSKNTPVAERLAVSMHGASLAALYVVALLGFTFPSGLSAFPDGARGAPRIKAEDPRGLGFVVASRCVFRPSEEYDSSMSDLRQFLEIVVKETGAHFVVSFQLEKTLFLHGGGGLQCL